MKKIPKSSRKLPKLLGLKRVKLLYIDIYIRIIMKYTTLCYLAVFFIFMIFVSIYFQWSYREGLVNIDPTIVNSNIPYGKGLSNEFILTGLNDFANQASKIKITKINVIGDNSIPPANETNNATISLNGRNIGPIVNNVDFLAKVIKDMSRGVKSIDIQYTS